MDRDRIIDLVVFSEGGSTFTQDPVDRGGATKYGITVPALSEFLGYNATVDDIFHLNESTARQFYIWTWDRFNVGKYPPEIQYAFYDSIINNGFGGASYLLQKALVALGQNIRIDNSAGPNTLAACLNVDPNTLMNQMIDERINFNKAIVARDPSQGRFLQGWINRAERVRNGGS